MPRAGGSKRGRWGKGHDYRGNQYRPDEVVRRLYEPFPDGYVREIFPEFPHNAFANCMKILSSEPPKAKSASEQKVAPIETKEYPELSGNRIINTELLLSFVNSMACPSCLQVNGFECVETPVGATSKFEFRCKTDLCDGTAVLPSSKEVPIEFPEVAGSFPETNSRVVSAFFSIGRNYRDLVKALSIMDIPPPSRKTWDKHLTRLRSATGLLAETSMTNAAREIRELTGSKEAVVSNDGSWQRRGFSSLNGVATTVGVEVKKVVDTEVKTSYCNSCSKMSSLRSETDFKLWQSKHIEDGKCSVNHSGSAGKMECDGILEIFSRSEIERGLVYTGYLGDGDSKSYTMVANANPPVYVRDDGSRVLIEKLECCGHIQKRMGNQLSSCVQSNKNKKFKTKEGKIVTGIGGKGGLTKVAIRRIQGHFGAAIRNNKGNLEAMRGDILQILLHRRGEHEECGDWCPSKSGDLEKANRSQLPKYVCDAIQPVFDRLSSDELLKKCLHGGDQNSNESLHSVVWQVVPKNKFVGLNHLQHGVSLATLLYNEGEQPRMEICSHLGYEPGRYLQEYCLEMNKERIEKSEDRCDPVFQTRRSNKRTANVAAIASQEAEEGVQYKKGEFSN
jgi:hypothetical protein